jgi:hypothetical protein
MNWSRGVLLAGIHLAVAVPLILFMEARDAQFVRDREESIAAAASAAAAKSAGQLNPVPGQASAEQEGETVSFDPCGMWVHYSVQEEIIQLVNIPANALTQWREDCPTRWSLSGMLHGVGWQERTPSWMAAQRRVAWGLFVLIALQWILVGGFPLVQTRRIWAEPGAFITACALAAFGLVAIPTLSEVARLPSLMAGLAWFWWFGLLVWKTLRSGWRLVSRVAEHSR